MVLLIREEDIRKANVTAEETIDAVEEAYRQDGRGLVQETPRWEIRIKGKDLPHIAPGTTSMGQGMAYLEESGALVVSHSFHFSWNKYLNYIIDPSDGKTLAIIMRGRAPLGERPKGEYRNYRTGAAAAIGAKYLARDNIETVGVIGTGRVGGTSLICLSKVRDFDKVLVHSGRRKDEEFAHEMSRTLGVDVVAVDGPEEAVRRADVLITATYATEPIVRGEWLGEGVHISAMGSDGPLKAELDAVVFERADKIVIDSEKCLTIGEIARPMEKGILRPGDIHGKIGEVVAGAKSGREDDSEITVFESDGTHMQSAAVAWKTYQKVKEMGLGLETSNLSSFFINP